jgi:hypothetical protein
MEKWKMTNVDINQFEQQLNGKLKAKIWHEEYVNADWTKTMCYFACFYNYYIVASGKTANEAKSQLQFLAVGNLALSAEKKEKAFQGIKPTPQDVLDIIPDEEFYVDPFNGITITRGKR